MTMILTRASNKGGLGGRSLPKGSARLVQTANPVLWLADEAGGMKDYVPPGLPMACFARSVE